MNRTCDVNRRASLRSSNIGAVATNQSSVLRKSATTTTLHNKSNLVRHGKIQPLPRQLCDEQNTSFDRAQNSIASGVATTSTRSRESTRREQEQLVDSERSREHIPTEYIKQHWYLPPKELERRWELSLLKEVRLREQIEKHWVGELVSFKGELWAKRRRDRNALRGNLRTSISLANIPFDPSYQKRQLSMLNSQN